MKDKLFDRLLLTALFGLALGFFGMLYEGVVLIPNMLNLTPAKMQFWHNFYLIINPIIFYIPLVPLATIILIVLYFTQKKQNDSRLKLGWAVLSQIVVMVLTIYIVSQINLKFYLSDIEKYADIIPAKTLLINILSVTRLIFSAIALVITFNSYIKTHQRILS
jgi:hypothetical protein